MEKKYYIDHSIRGDFYRIDLSKQCKNTPGFAPEWYTMDIGTITVRFRDDEPYFQTKECLLEKDEIKEIYDLLNRGYVEDDFDNI